MAALWRDVIRGGPRNAVWVLAPRNPLSAFVALAAADTSFQVICVLSTKLWKCAAGLLVATKIRAPATRRGC